VTLLGSSASAAASEHGLPPGQGGLPPGAIHNIMVIDIENEGFNTTFLNTPGYLRDTLEKQGELVPGYYATGHVSLDNYVAQVSGQAPNYATNTDCLGSTRQGAFNDVTPSTINGAGQAVGQGCVYPSSVRTIGDQLDAAYPHSAGHNWRVYAEDMGNDAARDGGVADPMGGTDCAHPTQTNGVGVDLTENAAPDDQFATRHDPFVFFHSVIDNAASCDHNVVPLGTVTVGANGAPDIFSGHLAEDLATPARTPRFSFVVPNLCDDGHDGTNNTTCAGTNTEGGKTGGLTGANLWLKHWMPLILNSPAYQSGHMLVVLTADEGNLIDTSAGDNEQPGPGNPNPGYSPILNVPIPNFPAPGLNWTYYQALYAQAHQSVPTWLVPGQPPVAGSMPGGGQVGALLLNPLYVGAGQTDETGSYNHYSALRTYEDLLGLNSGGSDGKGHLGFAATATAFGSDVFTMPTTG
jgi:hypothetical protein